VGAAYKITNKTVFHAGYGIYYARLMSRLLDTGSQCPVYDYWAFNNPATM